MNIEEMLNSGEIKIVQLAVNILKNEGKDIKELR